MDRFDEILKERAREEPFPLPEDYAGRVFQTCAALEETPVKHRRAPRWGLWMAAALALFIAVPNASPVAAAKETLPPPETHARTMTNFIR